MQYHGEGKKSRRKSEDRYKEYMEEKDWPLFEKLREWRKLESDAIDKPPFIVLNNAQLARIAHARPQSLAQLGELKIGESKRSKFGEAILEIVRKFAEEQQS